MATPTRFPKGVTNATRNTTLHDFPAMDPTKVHVFFDDFDRYVAGDWTITTAGAGSIALTDVDGGSILITNGALDDNHDFLQKVGESFALNATKKAWFKARFRTNDATQSDLVIGLQVTDTTPLAVNDGVWFQKDDGDASLDFHVANGGTQTDATAIATLSNDTFVVVGWYYDGTEIHYYVDDARVGSVARTNMPTTDLTVSFGIQNGEAAGKTMTVDYVMAAKER